MGWLLFFALITVCGRIFCDDASTAKFIADFCNPIQNNERVPRKGIFQPPNINCPTYAIVCHGNGLGFLEYCKPGQVFFSGACMNAPRQCSGQDEIDCRKYPGHQMVPKGCSSEFYWCTDGRMTKHSCQSNRYFNPKNGQCDFFENVALCNTDLKDAPPVVTTTMKSYEIPVAEPEKHPIDCRGKEDGDYPNPAHTCSSHYYTCANGITFRRNCSIGLHYDPDSATCQRKGEIPACGGVRIKTMLDDVCRERVNGNVVNPDSDGCSNIFYACNKGKAAQTKCADPAHVYNKVTDRCDLKKNVQGCDPGHCEGKTNGRYEVPGSNGCSSNYLECSNGRSYIQPCPPTLVYNKRSTRCEWRYDVEECGEPKLEDFRSYVEPVRESKPEPQAAPVLPASTVLPKPEPEPKPERQAPMLLPQPVVPRPEPVVPRPEPVVPRPEPIATPPAPNAGDQPPISTRPTQIQTTLPPAGDMPPAPPVQLPPCKIEIPSIPTFQTAPQTSNIVVPTYQFPPRNDLIFPPFYPDSPPPMMPVPPLVCNEFELFSQCPSSCEFTCPRRYDCYLPSPCMPSCRCLDGYSRRLSDGRCIRNNACYTSHEFDEVGHRSRDRDNGEDRGGEFDDGINDGVDDDADKFFCDERDDGFYAMPGGERCSELYYKCRQSKVDFWRCGRGKSFDESKGRCVKRSRGCWDKVDTLDSFFCQGKYESTNYSFPFPECSKNYYTCLNNKPQVQRCGDGFVFSDKAHSCVSSKRCRSNRRQNIDPDRWFCTDKLSDHGYSFPKSTCSVRYYQCDRNLAAFRRCPDAHYFDGFSCVPREYCLDTDNKEDSLDANIFQSGIKLRQSNICATTSSYSFVVTGAVCDPEFGICIDNRTTVHKCGRNQVFKYEDKDTVTNVYCTSLLSCLGNRSDDNQLQNKDFPLADDFCDDKSIGFYPEKDCGQKYGFCYCPQSNSTDCKLKLVRLTCPSRRYVFDQETYQCVLRRQVKACQKKFDPKEFCSGRKEGSHELRPCSNEYIDCDSFEIKRCPSDLVYTERRGCGRSDSCFRRPLVFSEDLYYPGPDVYPDMYYSGPNTYPGFGGGFGGFPYGGNGYGQNPVLLSQGPWDGTQQQNPAQQGLLLQSATINLNNDVGGSQFADSGIRQVPVIPVVRPQNSWDVAADSGLQQSPVVKPQTSWIVQPQSSAQQYIQTPTFQSAPINFAGNGNRDLPVVRPQSPWEVAADMGNRQRSFGTPPNSWDNIQQQRYAQQDRQTPVAQPPINFGDSGYRQNPVVRPQSPTWDVSSDSGNRQSSVITPQNSWDVQQQRYAPALPVQSPPINTDGNGYRQIPIGSPPQSSWDNVQQPTYPQKYRQGPVFQSVPTNTHPDSLDCIGKENGAFLRVPSDCRRFQRCVFGRLYDFNCPDKTVFNERLKTCDWPENVPGCGQTEQSPPVMIGYTS